MKEDALLSQDKHIIKLIEENDRLKNRINELDNIITEMSHSRPTPANSSQNVLDNLALIADIQTHVNRMHNRIITPNSSILVRNETQNSMDRIMNGANILLNRIHEGVQATRKEHNQIRLERDQIIIERD